MKLMVTESAKTVDNNLETLSLIFLTHFVESTKDNISVQQRLRSSINHLKIFEDIDECEQYIQSGSEQDRIVLIWIDQMGREIVPKIHELRQVFSIYIHFQSENINEDWTKRFAKVKGVIRNFDELPTRLRSNQTQRGPNEPLAMTIFNTSFDHEQSTTGLNGQFVHSQLLIDCLLRMESTTTMQHELIARCQQEYEGNITELAILSEFERDYSSDRALWWYTRESFVYRLLNKALRVQNIDLLFLFRFLIRDLREQLKQHRCSSPMNVFRGQLISHEELNALKNSLGKFISMNSFLSTSIDRHVAIFSLGNLTTHMDDDFQRVLFEVDVDPRLDNIKPFANITSFSYFPNEQEVLMMVGSIFRLVDILRDKDGIWIIRMTLCSDNDDDLRPLFDYLKNEYSGGDRETNLLYFANVLHHMSKFDEAEQYLHRLLNKLPLDHEDIPLCYYTFGVLAMRKGDYDSSLAWHHKSLEIKIRTLKSNDPALAHSQYRIGIIYRKRGDLKEALKMLNKALAIYTCAFGEDNLHVAKCIKSIGNVYYEEENYSMALQCHQNVLDIREKYLPVGHPCLGAIHSNLASDHWLFGNLDLALKHAKLSLEIYQKSVPIQHPRVGRVLEIAGHLHADKDDLAKALLYLEKAAAIYRGKWPTTHQFIIRIEQRIRCISSQIE